MEKEYLKTSDVSLGNNVTGFTIAYSPYGYLATIKLDCLYPSNGTSSKAYNYANVRFNKDIDGVYFCYPYALKPNIVYQEFTGSISYVNLGSNKLGDYRCILNSPTQSSLISNGSFAVDVTKIIDYIIYRVYKGKTGTGNTYNKYEIRFKTGGLTKEINNYEIDFLITQIEVNYTREHQFGVADVSLVNNETKTLTVSGDISPIINAIDVNKAGVGRKPYIGDIQLLTTEMLPDNLQATNTVNIGDVEVLTSDSVITEIME